MGIGVSLILIAVGLILALAVHPSGTHPVDPNTAGWILVVVGFIALILDLLLWESWGPGYLRRTTYAPWSKSASRQRRKFARTASNSRYASDDGSM